MAAAYTKHYLRDRRVDPCAQRASYLPGASGAIPAVSRRAITACRWARSTALPGTGVEQGRELFVLWLDAHRRLQPAATTITGNMHGMSGAFLCGEPGLVDCSAMNRGASITPSG